MGTAVLSPKDCLSSHHTRHDQPLLGMIYPSAANVPKSRRALQRSVHTVLPSVSSEYSKRNSLMSSPVAISLAKEGFAYESHVPLPGPDNLMSPTRVPISSNSSIASFSSPARMPSRVLSPCKVHPDSSCPPSSSYLAPSSKSVVLTSRSLSTGPLQQSSSSTSSSRESRHSSSGRQATRFSWQNSTQHKVGSADPSRSHNGLLTSYGISEKRIAERKYSSSGDYVFDMKKRTQGDLMNGSSDGHTDTKRNGKKGPADKVIIGNNSDAGYLQGSALRPNSVMRIIQRPKTKEAAVELLAKFRWKVEPAGVVEEVDFLNTPKGDGSQSTELAVGSKSIDYKDRACTNTGTDFASGELQTVLAVGAFLESPISARNEKGRVELLKNVSLRNAKSESLGVSGKVSSRKDEMAMDDNSRGVPKVAPSVASNERWAGPAYSNSPPPSSLPFPSFSIRPPKASSLDVPSDGDHDTGSSALSCHLDTSQSGPSSYESVYKSGIDVAFATKNLRRILNLDTW